MNDIATLTPPQGWKLLNGSQKQRFINEHLSGAEDIIAIALPDGGDGSVFAQLSYRPAGYVDENIQIDPTRVRKGISEDLDMLNQESGLSGNDAVRWKTFPPRPKTTAPTTASNTALNSPSARTAYSTATKCAWCATARSSSPSSARLPITSTCKNGALPRKTACATNALTRTATRAPKAHSSTCS